LAFIVNGCDAWVAPGLYNKDAQAGAPPMILPPSDRIGSSHLQLEKDEEDGLAGEQRFEQ